MIRLDHIYSLRLRLCRLNPGGVWYLRHHLDRYIVESKLEAIHLIGGSMRSTRVISDDVYKNLPLYTLDLYNDL